MTKWLSTFLTGLLVTVIGGVLVWVATENLRQQPPAETKPLSFLERAEGDYTLQSWTPSITRIELGAEVVEGALRVDEVGTADWTVLVQQTRTRTPGKVRMTARGRIVLGSNQIVGVQGGSFNNDNYLDNLWYPVGDEVQLAVRGWTYSTEDRFSITLDERNGGGAVLQMANSKGTFVWVR